MYKTNKTGYRGVCWNKRRNKYEAYHCIEQKRIHIGSFDDVHDAGCAASDWRLQHAEEIAAAKRRLSAQRSIDSKRSWAKKTPEERSEIARKSKMKMTPAQRSQIARKANAKLTKQEQREKGERAAAKLSPEEKRAIAARSHAKISRAKRQVAARKGWKTRRKGLAS
jgi:hypothetical protein